MPRRFPLLFVLATLLLARSPACADDPQPTRLKLGPADIKESLTTTWYGVYFQDRKIGFDTVTRVLVGKGDDARLIERTRTGIKMTSFNQKAEMNTTHAYEFEARPPYRLRRAESTESDGKTTRQIRLTTVPDGMEVTVTTNGQTRTRRIPALDYTLEDSLAADVWLKRGRKPGDRITVRELDLEDLKIQLTTSTLQATKRLRFLGVTAVYHKIESVMHKLGIQSVTLHDVRGRLLSGTLASVFALRRESEAEAKRTEYSADIFALGMVKIDKDVGPQSKLAGLVLHVPGKDGAFLRSASRQKVVVNADGSVTCKLGKLHAEPVKATAEDLKEFASETVAYPINLPRVKELARQAVGDAKTGAAKVKRLVKFVHDFVRPSLATTVPRLEDLLERKAGDCKSYALLFAVLARAAGLPARELSGVVYMGDGIKAFGGHAWNEVVIDGYWVPVDASMNETEVDPTHVSFGHGHDAIGNLASSLGRLSFRLVAAQRRE